MKAYPRRGSTVEGWRSGWGKRSGKSRIAVTGELLVVVAAMVVAGGAVAQQGRVALVVGNNDYEHIGQLSNPANDASDIAEVLERLEFRVTKLLNASNAAFRSALKRFAVQSDKAAIGLIFYAGHGLEMDGVNYLLPVDAEVSRDTDLMHDGLKLREDVLASMTGDGLRMVILDACRNLPEIKRMVRTRSRSVGNGGFGALRTSQLGRETLVAYASAAGEASADGTGQRNSPYTAVLKEQLVRQQDLADVFRAVRKQVAATTNEAQVPHEYSSLREKYYLAGKPFPAVKFGSAGLVEAGPAATVEVARLELEKELWESIKTSRESADYAAYLMQYPKGNFAALAKTRLQRYRDEESWNSASARSTLDAFLVYLQEYPKGRFAELARTRLNSLAGKLLKSRSSIGIKFNIDQSPSLLRRYGADSGVFVGRVVDDGPAEDAGMQAEDIITHVNGREIRDVDELIAVVSEIAVGDTVPISVVRDGKSMKLDVAIADRAEVYSLTVLERAVEQNAVDVIRLLLDAGASVDARDDDGWTPLHLAARGNAEEAARVLLEYGASRREVPEEYRGRLSQ